MRLVLNPPEKLIWHTWFAWHPVLVNLNENTSVWVWGETVERKKIRLARVGWGYVHRLKKE